MSLLVLLNPDTNFLVHPASIAFDVRARLAIFFKGPDMALNVGDECPITVTITDDISGIAYDPASLVFWVQAPDGTSTQYAWGSAPNIEKLATGQYRLDVYVTQPKRWFVVAICDGAIKGREQWQFEAFSTRADIAIPP